MRSISRSASCRPSSKNPGHGAPRRPATSSELADIAAARAAYVAFVHATDTYAQTADLLQMTDTAGLERGWDAALHRLESARWSPHVVKGPAGLFGVGAKGVVTSNASSTWAAEFTTAFWREELGQWRPHGLGPLSKFILVDVQTAVDVGPSGVRWLGNHATLFEFARITTQPRSAPLRWLSRVGWGVAVSSHVQPKRAAADVRLDGYLLLADGVESAWTVGLRAGVQPSAEMGERRAVDIAAAAEPFAQRRLGSTGRIAASARFQRSYRTQRMEAELAFVVPWGAREAWWTTLRMQQTCDATWRCRLGWSGGLAW